MKHIPKKTDLYKLQDRFHISRDELEARMDLQRREHDIPLTKAVKILDEARDKVMRSLGVDTEQPPEMLQLQQENLGIVVTQETRPEMAGLNGWFIYAPAKKKLTPIAWVGSAYLDSNGDCWCEIHWFQENRMEKYGGAKIIKSDY